MQRQWQRKDLLGCADLEDKEIMAVLEQADAFREISSREIKKVPTLRGKTVINLFHEPSTRTRASFEIAGKRLSADVVNVTASDSSVSKGETLLDMARNLEAMSPDVVVVRHASAGAPHSLARVLACGVVNAGDGAHEHPTQALLDCYTIREHAGKLEGLKVAIVGDIAHSRVARSNIYAMRTLGMRVTVCGPPTLLPVGIEGLGVEATSVMEEAVAGVDVIMMLRVQFERMGMAYFPSLREYSRFWCLTSDRLSLAKPDVLIMHPGPINRGVEIAHEVADGPHSVILEQVTNGVAVRMALLYLLAGGRRDASAD
ncbi:MAG: aspartate carbamoyltransferase catalytic subunit [Nitrospinae bacterium]|nr:aspartate carbamoyltransferase catalytic subunit [Nitrospinota bacterium]